MDYSKLPTEKQNPKTRSLHTLSIEKILRLMDEEDRHVAPRVARMNPAIARAVGLIVGQLRKGGRLFFFGAGTSGRLGILEAAECPPTFNTPPRLIQAVMAGGRSAVFRSCEGAEDRRLTAEREVRRRVRRGDVAIGISASGVTPFVESALQTAKKQGAKTILISCNPASRVRSKVDVLIAPQVGPEIIAGSTRLKAGTATKLILNRLTVAVMVRLGKVYKNWMVDLRPLSKKLRARALRILKELGGVSEGKADRLLQKARGSLKAAILMARNKVSYEEACRALKKERKKEALL